MLGEKVVFVEKQFYLAKPLVYYGNKSNGYRKQSPKIWAWSDNFSAFYRDLKFK